MESCVAFCFMERLWVCKAWEMEKVRAFKVGDKVKIRGGLVTPRWGWGMELGRGKTHGKMECWEPIARSLQNLTVTRKFQQSLDFAKSLPFPDGIVINGDASSTSFTGDPGKTYMFRISNVGLSTSFNFKIQGHNMKLVEVEGSHTIQNIYTSLDVHVGQSLVVLVNLDQIPKDYYIVASTLFTRNILTTTAVLHYSNSKAQVSRPLPT
ncbi:hypothetical protein MRB53_002261 [Persea americana]|uniref:Uncharacterized protein n=1 Tax=Persea americana TaxID=3435 RepID=A0ACC2MUC0_PERAE|nr:hypothetical protein MRB53_002261 [Persea americana]